MLDLDKADVDDSTTVKGNTMELQIKRSINVERRTMSASRGFTLLELIVVVAIIAILVSVAIPNYRDYVLRAKVAEATSNLADWRNRMERFYQDNRTYLNPAGACGTAAPTGAVFFGYACAATAQTYRLTANGVAAQGMAGFTYVINESNVKTSTVNFGGTTASSANCWLTKTGGC